MSASLLFGILRDAIGDPRTPRVVHQVQNVLDDLFLGCRRADIIGPKDIGGFGYRLADGLDSPDYGRWGPEGSREGP